MFVLWWLPYVVLIALGVFLLYKAIRLKYTKVAIFYALCWIGVIVLAVYDNPFSAREYSGYLLFMSIYFVFIPLYSLISLIWLLVWAVARSSNKEEE